MGPDDTIFVNYVRYFESLGTTFARAQKMRLVRNDRAALAYLQGCGRRAAGNLTILP